MIKAHLISYIDRSDVDVVLARVPDEIRRPLRDVFFARGKATRVLGWVTRGRRDITLCSVLPPRLSLRKYMYRGAVASDFGAPARGQWPPWAVRRFLLYCVLLHELAHLQVVDRKQSTNRRRYADEVFADEIAHELRGSLYSGPFDHPDPVHNAPSADEVAMLELWDRLDKLQRELLAQHVVSAPHRRSCVHEGFGPLGPEQRHFLARVLFHDA
jgi:hypothetical protein